MCVKQKKKKKVTNLGQQHVFQAENVILEDYFKCMSIRELWSFVFNTLL